MLTLLKVGISILALALLSIIRGLLFEIYQKSHYLLAVLTAYSLWFHIKTGLGFLRIYLATAIVVFVVTTLARCVRLVIRNWRWHRPFSAATVVRVQDIIRIKIEVTRPWKIQAGQYIYLWLPGTSFWSIFQCHPFMIAWWDHNPDGKGSNIYLLVEPKAGFTQKLMRHQSGTSLIAWVDGPYGHSSDVIDFGSLLMFASGIGIAAHIPYLKKTLASLRGATSRTRNILLIWQLNKES